MTHDTAPRREDARDLQAKLYREIGISAVAAALRFTTQPDPAPQAQAGLDRTAATSPVVKARAA
ncbi:hypothetical protein D3273_12320 [Lichenibacterium minor]|jgi:hypothetical protein|uniref:Uncharacterized protein n=1 Tax=Lichenibacterium minor TaxID=2316528 RepID=A0A4Q2U6Z5_9HYPH|nr:hypothetical protein [Lichenibacterium minor]RYC31658.1 hypothetical protein D3273_12320 [Lichenibacterium minor]